MADMEEANRKWMSIGQVSRATGIAPTAIRYYEREGVLIPTVRSRAGYRLYDRRAVHQLEFIQVAQAVGFTLDDIRVLLELDGRKYGRKKRCKIQVQEIIRNRLAEVDQKMRDLRRIRVKLGAALRECEGSDGQDCPVLQELHSLDKKPQAGK